MTDFTSQHFARELVLMARGAFSAHGAVFWQMIAVLVFALVFLILGFYRVVEFNGLDLPPRLRRILIALHLTGVTFFAAATALFGIDVLSMHLAYTGAILGIALVFLLPVHIYINLVRRIRLKDRQV